jgi:hypothetical protein
MADEKIPQNKRARNDLTADYVRSILDYDKDAGHLIWKYRPDMPKWWNTRWAGEIAGSLDTNGYYRVTINYATCLVHRVAWLIVKGEWPKPEADHRDGNPANNRWDNLRQATRINNLQNRGKMPSNTSGFKGVHWHKKKRRWRAVIRANGKRHYLGVFKTAAEAGAAYDAAAVRLHGEFARQS